MIIIRAANAVLEQLLGKPAVTNATNCYPNMVFNFCYAKPCVLLSIDVGIVGIVLLFVVDDDIVMLLLTLFVDIIDVIVDDTLLVFVVSRLRPSSTVTSHAKHSGAHDGFTRG